MPNTTESLRAVLAKPTLHAHGDGLMEIVEVEEQSIRRLEALASALARLEAAERLIGDLRGTIDAMMRECGSEPSSRYAKNACIIGAAALAREESLRE